MLLILWLSGSRDGTAIVGLDFLISRGHLLAISGLLLLYKLLLKITVIVFVSACSGQRLETDVFSLNAHCRLLLVLSD